MAMAQGDIDTAVQEAVVGALGVGEDEVTPDATIMDDLGAESIDLLDILFRIERNTGVKIQAADIGAYIQGGLSDDEFSDDQEILTPKGMEQLKTVMPQLDTDSLQGTLHAEQVMSHFTVQNLAQMVAERAASSG